MGFMRAYKHLDNLCRDMNGIGITGYIEDMEKRTNGSIHVFNWKQNYQQLKHYRHIRNQIAHEDDADEETLCSVEDIEWLDNFYQQILKQSDPLALYYKATESLLNDSSTRKSNSQVKVSPQYTHKQLHASNKKLPILLFILITVFFITVTITFLIMNLFFSIFK